MDLFQDRKILPMLLKKNSQPFDSDDYIFELKLDGIRCLAYLDKNEMTLINRRFKNITKVYPELKNINKQVKEKCILDGELVYIDENGKPDFNILMTRSLSMNSFKIAVKSKSYPVTFVAFDILYYKGEDITSYNLLKRKAILNDNIVENSFINVSRYIENHGKILFEKVKEQNLEGVIAKLKRSTYQIGKRSGDWIKIKNLIDEDFIICGYTLDEDNRIKDLVLGQYD
ncbi:MAG: RNA ligase family protein, partial [Clostridia bacterium]|nr:RNA ligase family protein [Clostridia bacterium]